MDEVTLGALITTGGAVLIAVIQLLSHRIDRQVTRAPEPAATGEADLLRVGIRRHIPLCKAPADLIDLL